MENQADELFQQNSQFKQFSSFQYPYQSLRKNSLSSNIENINEHLQMSNNLKFIHQKYPLKNIFEIEEEDINNFMQNNKHFHGIKYLFGLQGQKNDDFLEDIDSQIFNTSFYQNPNLVDLNKLFQDQQSISQSTQYKKLLNQLTTKLSQIQNKAFTGISIHKTLGKAFYDHFENYLKLRNSSSFFQNFQISFQKFVIQSKKIKNNGLSLILIIYQFWMRMFRQFVRQIWRHSEKYSQGLFKKDKVSNQNRYQVHSNRSSTSSSQQGEKIQKQKRRPWSKDQIQILEKIINSNATFNAIRLQKLAEEFGRSSTSISSKIQKIVKFKKSIQNNTNQDTIQKKIDFVLKINPQGLSKDDVIKKINQMYEMGLEQNWKKSVCQILSSKKSIQKIKGTFRLINPQYYYKYENSQTLKDKIIQILLKFQNNQADLKALSNKYIQLYYQKDQLQDKQKIKIIENNLSKALNRYEIFQKTNQKVIYKLLDYKEEYNQQMQVENYLN